MSGQPTETQSSFICDGLAQCGGCIAGVASGAAIFATVALSVPAIYTPCDHPIGDGTTTAASCVDPWQYMGKILTVTGSAALIGLSIGGGIIGASYIRQNRARIATCISHACQSMRQWLRGSPQVIPQESSAAAVEAV